MSVRTGNAVTDVIVNDKQKAAEKQGIRFRSDFVYPASDRYNAYDIAIIVNNLLQNALEACGRMASGEKYISLSGSRKNRFFLISVPNCRPLSYTLTMVCMPPQAMEAPEHTLLSPANILLLFSASSSARQGSGQRNKCRHAGDSHSSLLGRTPGWRAATPVHTSRVTEIGRAHV